ncbi:hypothetical protein [Dasania marina]|uniref:hypothetical protein n=1 Tax=Dasania marina TaxID=471499 RepID=UPI00037BF357|nr:hypothetical protein [Dasania marina]
MAASSTVNKVNTVQNKILCYNSELFHLEKSGLEGYVTKQSVLEVFGFKFGRSGAHSARSMMIAELTTLMAAHPEGATAERFKEDVLTFNLLHKPTSNSRRLTYRHLVDLYGLTDDVCLFRVFRKLWLQAPSAQPVLALQLALCRDPLLRASMPKLMALEPGESITRQDMEALLEQHNPGGYSAASLKSFAQNINGSWTQAGFLLGRARKTRSQAPVHAVNVAFALFIASLQGLQGQRGFNSEWCQLLSRDTDQLYQLAHVASLHGYLRFKQSSEVVEVTFPGWLNDNEKELFNG